MTHHRDRPLGRRLDMRLRCEDGVESLEVALIGALIVIAIMVAVPTLAEGVGNALESVAAALQTAGAGIE